MNQIIALMFITLTMLATTLKAQEQEKTTESKMGLFVEPMLTYEYGDTDVNYPSPISNSTGTIQGFGVGARAGIHFMESLFVGLDGRYSMPHQFKDSSVGYNAKATSYNWGPVIGIQMPHLGLRLWGSYVVDGELDPERDGNIDIKFKQGHGARVGAGFRISSFSVNIEYQQLRYNQTQIEKLGVFTPGSKFSSVNLDNNAWIASLSFPIEL